MVMTNLRESNLDGSYDQYSEDGYDDSVRGMHDPSWDFWEEWMGGKVQASETTLHTSTPARGQGLLASQELYQYILETSVYPREPEPLKEIREATADHPWSLIATTPEGGQLMALLLKRTHAKKTIEIGIFTGYSALLTALVLPEDGKDMFAAGTDTTYTVMEWIMAELLRNPKGMKKVQEEVRGVAEGKLMITEDMLHQMNYLKSVIKETMRLHPPLPLLVSRESTKSSKIYGYDIPAKTRVMVNAWAIGRDPKSWEDPDKFQPERFMDGGNKSHVDFRGHDFELIPFGAGRRICPGIHFAISTIQCALANLLHRFDWKMADGVDTDLDEGHGITIHKKTPLILAPTPCFP